MRSDLHLYECEGIIPDVSEARRIVIVVKRFMIASSASEYFGFETSHLEV